MIRKIIFDHQLNTRDSDIYLVQNMDTMKIDTVWSNEEQAKDYVKACSLAGSKIPMEVVRRTLDNTLISKLIKNTLKQTQ